MSEAPADTVEIVGGGDATDEEVAAVMAAVTLLLSGGGDRSPGSDAVPRWRFSGRWWTKPIPSRRDRP